MVGRCRDVVLVARARLQATFHEIAWALDHWRCSRCQRYARNKSTLAALKRTACVPLFGAARGATPSLPRVRSSHRIRRSGPIMWCTMCGAYSSNRSLALRHVAQEHVPLTQGASVCISWSLVATGLRELGCWMMQLSPRGEFCWSTAVRALALTSHDQRKGQKSKPNMVEFVFMDSKLAGFGARASERMTSIQNAGEVRQRRTHVLKQHP